MSTARSSIWSRTGSRMRGTPRLSSLTLGFDWSGSSLNSSSPAITASCDSMIEENHIRRVVRYTHAKDSQPLRCEHAGKVLRPAQARWRASLEGWRARRRADHPSRLPRLKEAGVAPQDDGGTNG